MEIVNCENYLKRLYWLPHLSTPNISTTKLFLWLIGVPRKLFGNVLPKNIIKVSRIWVLPIFDRESILRVLCCSQWFSVWRGWGWVPKRLWNRFWQSHFCFFLTLCYLRSLLLIGFMSLGSDTSMAASWMFLLHLQDFLFSGLLENYYY